MVCKSNRVFDPLDLEILERAFDGAWTAFKESQFASDTEFEALLHRELTEIAAFNGANDDAGLSFFLTCSCLSCWFTTTTVAIVAAPIVAATYGTTLPFTANRRVGPWLSG